MRRRASARIRHGQAPPRPFPPAPWPRSRVIAIGYRMGTITSFPFGKPVLSSLTRAGIASDSGTMRPIAGTSLPLGGLGDAGHALRGRVAEHQVMSRREKAADQLGGGGDDVQRHAVAFQHRAALAQRNAPAVSKTTSKRCRYGAMSRRDSRPPRSRPAPALLRVRRRCNCRRHSRRAFSRSAPPNVQPRPDSP